MPVMYALQHLLLQDPHTKSELLLIQRNAEIWTLLALKIWQRITGNLLKRWQRPLTLF